MSGRIPYFGRFDSAPVPLSSFDDRKVPLKTYDRGERHGKKVFLVSISETGNEAALLEWGNEEAEILHIDEALEFMENSVDCVFVIGSRREFLKIAKKAFEGGYRKKIIVFEEVTVVPWKEYGESAAKALEITKRKAEEAKKAFGFPDVLTPYDRIRKSYHFLAKKRFKRKSRLDEAFFFAMRAAHAENFLFSDERRGRKILVLDVNSMYPYCCTLDDFPDAANLERVDFPDPEDYPAGIYSVRLSRKTTPDAFSEKYSYFKYAKNNVRLPVETPKEFETILHGNEIRFWKKYYDMEIYEGIVSETSVRHPLADVMRELYEKRKSAESEYESKLYKSLMVFLSSAYFREFLKRAKNEREWRDILRAKFFIGEPNEIYPGKYFSSLKYPDISNPMNVFSLTSQMYANNNVKLASILETIYFSGLDAEIAYVNVDSVHVSVSDGDYAELLEILSPLMGNDLGELKLEAIGDEGYWFDVGKYAILKNGEIVKEAGLDGVKVYGYVGGVYKSFKYDPKRALSHQKRVVREGRKKVGYRVSVGEVEISPFSVINVLRMQYGEWRIREMKRINRLKKEKERS